MSAKDHTMGARDMAIWGLVALLIPPICQAAWIWAYSLGGQFTPSTLPALAPWSLGAAAVLLLGPWLAVRVGGRALGRAVSMGAAISPLALLAALLLLHSLGWDADWGGWWRRGALLGLILALAWAASVRRYRLAWLLGATAWGLPAALLGEGVGGPHYSGLFFGLIWSLLGLPLVWLLRMSHPQGATVPRWRLAWPGLAACGAALALAAIITALQPCAPLDRALGRSGCVGQIARGDLVYLHDLRFAPDGGSVFLGGGDRSAGLVERRTLDGGTLLASWHVDQEIMQLAVSANGTRLIGVSPDDTLYVWDVASGRELRRFTVSMFDSDGYARISADGHYAVLFLNIYDLDRGVALGSATPQTLAQYGLGMATAGRINVWSPDGSLQTALAAWPDTAVQRTGYRYAYDVALLRGDAQQQRFVPAAAALRLLPGPVSNRPRLAFSPDGALLAILDDNDYALEDASDRCSTLRVWRVSDGALLYTGEVPRLSELYDWSPDGRTIALGGMGGPVRLIRVRP
jgi:hypothetical protein